MDPYIEALLTHYTYYTKEYTEARIPCTIRKSTKEYTEARIGSAGSVFIYDFTSLYPNIRRKQYFYRNNVDRNIENEYRVIRCKYDYIIDHIPVEYRLASHKAMYDRLMNNHYTFADLNFEKMLNDRGLLYEQPSGALSIQLENALILHINQCITNFVGPEILPKYVQECSINQVYNPPITLSWWRKLGRKLMRKNRSQTTLCIAKS